MLSDFEEIDEREWNGEAVYFTCEFFLSLDDVRKHGARHGFHSPIYASDCDLITASVANRGGYEEYEMLVTDDSGVLVPNRDRLVKITY